MLIHLFVPARFVDMFVEQIESAVEEAITQKLKEATITLDSSLQSLPKEIPIDDISSLNATIVDEPVLSNSSIGLQINGLFAASDQTWKPKSYEQHLETVACDNPSKMIGISIDEAVFLSASDLYFEVTPKFDCIFTVLVFASFSVHASSYSMPYLVEKKVKVLIFPKSKCH